MKNKREIAKFQTLDKIIKETKELIIENGILHLKTIDVAQRAKIAHGTVFAHFATKELLVSEICRMELKQIAVKLKEMAENHFFTVKDLVENYLKLIAENEDFYVVLAKEFPFLNEEIQHSIIGNETIIKNILYQKIETGVNNRDFDVTDITMTISFLFAAINQYLSRKEYYVKGKDSLMSQKKVQIIETFLKLLI